MTVQTVPTSSEPYYDMAILLSEKQYVLRFRYNTRETCWYMSVLNASKESIVDGIKVVPGVDLLGQYSYNTDLPPGTLFVFINGTNDGPPSQLELGDGLRAEISYVT